MMRRFFTALLGLFAAPIIWAQTPTTCVRVGSAATIQAATRDTTCILKSGAVSYRVTVLAARATPDTQSTKPPVDTSSTKPPVVDTTSTTANVLNNVSFESGWDGFTNWTGAGTPTLVTRDSTTAAAGRWSVRRAWTAGAPEASAQFMSKLPPSDRVWVRFSFKLTAPVTSIMKFVRFYDTANSRNLGGFFLGSGADVITFGTDQENQAITTPIGLTEARVIDGKWHTLELDYWRNGDPSGWPSAAFTLDGAPVSLPDGTKVKYAGAGNVSYWRGGRLYVGQRASSVQAGYIQWLSTLNAGNKTTGQVNIDRVSISTVGRP